MLMALLGFAFAQGYMQSSVSIVLFMISLVSYLGFSFSINECSDVKEDLINPLKKNPVAKGNVKLKNALAFSLILAAIGIAATIPFGPTALLFYILISFLTFSYSMPPMRLKSRFILDLVSNRLFFGILLFFLPFFLFGSQITAQDGVIASSIFYASVMIEFINHIQDYRWDKKAGIKTTVTELGPEFSQNIVKFMVFTYPLFALALSISLGNLLIFLPTLIFYPFFYFKPSLYSKNYLKTNYFFLGLYVIIIYVLAISTFLMQQLLFSI